MLKTPNNLYQQTHHRKLNRMVQTILSWHARLLRYFFFTIEALLSAWERESENILKALNLIGSFRVQSTGGGGGGGGGGEDSP